MKNLVKKNKNKLFSLLVISMLSLSIIVDLDFNNLSALDWSLLVSTGVMWLVNGIYFARQFFN